MTEPTEKSPLQVQACTLINTPWVFKHKMGLVVLRIAVASMMLVHGIPKLLMLLEGKGGSWLNPIGIGATTSLALCVIAEFACSMALILGLFTRLASFVLIINFWVILFVVDAGSTWADKELAALYLVCFCALLCTGAGPCSIDHWMSKKLKCSYPQNF